MYIEPIDTDDGLEEVDNSKGRAIIDADTLVYTSCLEVEQKEELLPKCFYSENELDEIYQTQGFSEKEWAIYTIDPDLLLEVIKTKVSQIQNETSTKKVLLVFSSGENFRHKIFPEYKSNRKSLRYPEGLEWAKSEILYQFEGIICNGYEADDYVVLLKKENPEDVLCAVDKDVLKSVPGRHFDYYYQRMCFIETTATDSLKWPYIQCLAGDSADGISGLQRVGVKTAEKLLSKATLPNECWEIVKEAYLSKGKTIEEAKITMQIVWMHSLYRNENGEIQIKLWEEPNE